ncbi:MAG: hypothetical protein R3B90_04460 [Planctomycetaceae bacterium]
MLPKVGAQLDVHDIDRNQMRAAIEQVAGFASRNVAVRSTNSDAR